MKSRELQKNKLSTESPRAAAVENNKNNSHAHSEMRCLCSKLWVNQGKF